MFYIAKRHIYLPRSEPKTVKTFKSEGDSMNRSPHEIAHLDIHTLRYFLAIVQEGSVVGAAKRLHLTQPTLSRQINALEKRLGAELYIREGRQIRLTDKGRVLYAYAESVVELVDKAEVELVAEESRVTGSIFVGHGETSAMDTLARAFAVVQKRHPQVTLELFAGDTVDLFDRLETGFLDFLLESEPLPRPDYDQHLFKGSDVWGIFLRKSDLLSRFKTIAPRDLIGKNLLTSRQALRAGMIERWAGAAFERITFNVNINMSASTAKSMALSGVTYVLGYRDIVGISEEDDLCFRPIEPSMESRRALTWKRTRKLSPAAQALLDALREVDA